MSVVESAKEQLLSSGMWSVDPAHSAVGFRGLARTADERRCIKWVLLACEEVCGVFSTARDDTLAMLFRGDRVAFRDSARSLEPELSQ